MSQLNGTTKMAPLNIFESDLRPMQYWRTQSRAKVQLWKSGVVEGYSTGFTALDARIRLVDSDLVLVAGRPSMGKTALGMQMVEHVAREIYTSNEKGCVAVFSAEMSGWRLYIRMASALAGVNSHDLSMGKGQPGDAAKLEDAIDSISDLPIWIDDGTSPSTETMLARLGQLNANIPVRMMLFDFLELGGDSARSEELRIGNIAKSLKGIAKTLQIPVVALSQLNREVENRANKMPHLSDLRYSGMLEQAADIVLFLMRPHYYIERGISVDMDGLNAPVNTENLAYVQVAKNRNGSTGLAALHFDGATTRFGNLMKQAVNLNP